MKKQQTPLEIQMKKYVGSKAWDKDKDLSKFKKILNKSLILLVLLRAESKDVKKGKNKGNSDSQGKSFRMFDKAVFNGQLEKKARKKIIDSKKAPHLNECIFKELKSNLKKLVELENVIKNCSVGSLDKINVKSLEELKKTFDEANKPLQSILQAVDSYETSKHCKILKRVRLRKQFFEVFHKSLENFKLWGEEISSKVSEHLGKEENKNKSQAQEAKDEEKSSDQSQDREAKDGEEPIDQSQDEKAKDEEKSIDQSQDEKAEGKQSTKSESADETPIKKEISAEEYPLKDLLFIENVYNKSKSFDPEQQLEHAKKVILHAFVCFIGVCKYAYLQSEEYGKAIEKRNDLSLQNIDWDENLIKSLKNSKSWEGEVDKLSGVVSQPFTNQRAKTKSRDFSEISKQKSLEELIELLSRINNKQYYSPSVNSKSTNEKIDRLKKNFDEAIDCFDKWRYQIRPYLNKLIILRDWPKTVKEIEENEDKNNKKREVVTKDKEANNRINNALKEQWKKNKYKDLESKKRKDLWQTVEEANEAHKKLEQQGILFEKDNSTGSTSAAGYSENFVKLFIRYLERSFPELDDCVKIYYYASPIQAIYGCGCFTTQEHSKKYWNKVRYLKKVSKSDGMIYFVVNQGVPIENRKKGKDGGHGNLTIVCDGKYKVFESAGEELAGAYLGSKDYGTGDIKLAGKATIQKDTQNCLTMALGYVESLMKQISKNKEEWKTGGKSVSECFSKEVNKFSTVKLPEDITGPNKEQPLKILLPSKYVKYMQTGTGIQKLIKYARNMDKDNKDYAILQEVADELESVTKKYSLSNQPAKAFLPDVVDSIPGNKKKNERDIAELEKNVEKLAKLANLKDPTVGGLTSYIGKRKLTTKKLEEIKNEDIGDSMAIIDLFKSSEKDSMAIIDLLKSSEKEWVQKELTENNIYKVFIDDPLKMTYKDFKKLENFLNTLMLLPRINDRAQMKRRTETLKIATLVDTLNSNGGNVQDEIDAVRDF